jgi:hypothetical protein
MITDTLYGIALIASSELFAPLRARAQWCVYKPELNPKTGHVDKIPLTPMTLKRAKTNDFRTWATFDVARAALERLSGKGYGLGFILAISDPFFGVDLDDVIDPTTGHVSPFACETLVQLPCYAEFSPSGRGLRFLGCGRLPSGRRKITVDGKTVECYDSLRFFTITGNLYGRADLPIIPDTDAASAALQAALDAWYARTFGEGPPEPPAPADSPPPGPAPDAPEDAVLLDRIFASRRGDRIRRLWDGGAAEGEGVDTSRSAGDFALCVELAFWTRGNAAWIDRLFRASPRMRDKWNERRGSSTYGGITIARAVQAYAQHRRFDPDPDPPPDEADPQADDPDPNPAPEDTMTGPSPQSEFRLHSSVGNGEVDPAAGKPSRASGELVLPFPVDIFPPAVAEYARTVARTMPCPLDFVGLAIVTIAGSLIGATRAIAPKPSWQERPLLYGAVVGPAGDKKSPALDAVARPLYREAMSFVNDFTARMEFYERNLLVYEADLAAWKRARQSEDCGGRRRRATAETGTAHVPTPRGIRHDRRGARRHPE